MCCGGGGYAELVCRVDIAATSSDCIGPRHEVRGVRWGHAVWRRDAQSGVARHGDVAPIEGSRFARRDDMAANTPDDVAAGGRVVMTMVSGGGGE